MNKFNQNHDVSNEQSVLISIELAESLIDRIKKTVIASDVEEGGKFLGRINYDENKVLIKINTFIDSGPGASKSSTHLHPDGEYQEALYRVIELFDPDIEHIGTWHSHHCNGLPHLSGGDIRGYIESVNDCNYNSKYFIVMLVVATRGSTIDYHFYLFVKGLREYYQLKPGQVDVHTPVSQYFLEPLLQLAERFSKLKQGPMNISTIATASKHNENNPNNQPHKTNRVNSGQELIENVNKTQLQKFRSEDSKWFKEHLPRAKTLQNQKTQSVIWQYEKNVNDDVLTLRYEYPPENADCLYASITLLFNGQPLANRKISLDETRFGVIHDLLRDAEESISKSIKQGDTYQQHEENGDELKRYNQHGKLY